METNTERNCRIQKLYDDLMQEGNHGHYETMFRIVRLEVEAEREECARVCHLYAVDNRIHSLATRGAHDCEKAIRMRSNVQVSGREAASAPEGRARLTGSTSATNGQRG